jgi:hypothetical protein
VRSGRFTSSDVAITAAVRSIRQREEPEEAHVMQGIQQGLYEMRAGRTQPLTEAFAEIRRDLNLPPGSPATLPSPSRLTIFRPDQNTWKTAYRI